MGIFQFSCDNCCLHSALLAGSKRLSLLFVDLEGSSKGYWGSSVAREFDYCSCLKIHTNENIVLFYYGIFLMMKNIY